MLISIDYGSDKPIYEQIIEQIKYQVMKKNLQPGDAIPSVRKLAQSLNITPSTVAKAYKELERQKVIETLQAKGTFIARMPQMKADEEKVEQIRKRIASELLELKMMGYTDEQMMKLVEEVNLSMKGEKSKC